MTQENKALLIKDLCARLPYGVKFKSDSIRGKSLVYDTLEGINGDLVNPVNEFAYDIENIKPYLFPMASMTAEQYNEAFKDSKNNPYPESDFIDYLNSHHFDYRGLIEKGLAIDATNLNIY